MDDVTREKIKKIIEFPDEIKEFEDLSTLRLTSLKGISGATFATLSDTLNINTIEDLATRNIKDHELTILRALGIKEFNLNVWRAISKMVINKEIRRLVESSKISIFGLENAGKTTLLNILQKKISLENIHNLKPTKGVDRKFMERLGVQFAVFDMGGQEPFRIEYINNPEKYFVGIELLVFVIDIQDSKNYHPAQKYLEKILELITSLNESPEFFIVLHKYDPDVEDKEEIQKAIKSIKFNISTLFQKTDFKFDVSTCSIYNYFGYSVSGSKGIKQFLKQKPEQMEKSLAETIEHVLNLVINLSTTVEDRISSVERSLQNLREWVEDSERIQPSVKPEPSVRVKAERKFRKIQEPETLSQIFLQELKEVLKMRKIE